MVNMIEESRRIRDHNNNNNNNNNNSLEIIDTGNYLRQTQEHTLLSSSKLSGLISLFRQKEVKNNTDYNLKAYRFPFRLLKQNR